MHTEMSAAAFALVYEKGWGQRAIFNGGFNVGVRYWLNGTLLSPPDFSFAAFARASRYPSESGVMKDYVMQAFGLPSSAVLLEQTSATTEENAYVDAQILNRTNFLPPIKTLGLLTNLYHMPRAFISFRSALSLIGIQPCPVFAEDMVCLLGLEWIDRVIAYYKSPHGGRMWNTTALQDIMVARLKGDLGVSVASLVDMQPCF